MYKHIHPLAVTHLYIFHPIPTSRSSVSNTFCPQRFQIVNFILEIPNPRTMILLLISPLCGVNALGTSTSVIMIA